MIFIRAPDHVLKLSSGGNRLMIWYSARRATRQLRMKEYRLTDLKFVRGHRSLHLLKSPLCYRIRSHIAASSLLNRPDAQFTRISFGNKIVLSCKPIGIFITAITHLDVSPGRAATGMGRGDLVGWIDDRLSRADEHDSPDSAAQGWNVLVAALRNVYGVSDKVPALISHTLGAADVRPRWLVVGVLIAVGYLGAPVQSRPSSRPWLQSARWLCRHHLLSWRRSAWPRRCRAGLPFRVLSFVTIFAARAPQIFKRPGRPRAFFVFQ
jgi:hypothetical protein